MRFFETAGLLAVAVTLGGCFQSTTVLHVSGDGSGTLVQRTVFTGAALAQFRQFAQMANPNAKTPELLSEDQARSMAASLGPGARYVSSTPVRTDGAEGRESLYEFPDVRTLKIAQQPPGPGGVTVRADSLGPQQDITFSLEPAAGGDQVLHIHMPDLRKLPGLPGAPQPGSGTPTPAPTDQQIELVKQMFTGLRILVAVEPNGRLVKTSSPFSDGNRVTLLDIDFDQIVSNPDAFEKLKAIKTPEDAQTVVKAIPGIKLTLDRDVTIEFAPAK